MIRRLTAALMVLVLTLAPLFGASGSASASTRVHTAAEGARTESSTPKPCKKVVLPGAINTCPFASVSFTAVPADESLTQRPLPTIRALAWRPGNDARPSQWDLSSPYRPPCRLT
jgi:hypothetical protein